MASRRRLRRNACRGKIRYADPASANAAMQEMIRKHRTQRSKGWLNIYQCRWCNGFHVGHR